jgi:hypothetical protein
MLISPPGPAAEACEAPAADRNTAAHKRKNRALKDLENNILNASGCEKISVRFFINRCNF